MHSVGALTDCDSGEGFPHFLHLPEYEGCGKRKHHNHDSSTQLQSCFSAITLDSLTNLPLNVLECIVGYLSVIDTLIMCYTSPLLNEHISWLHDSWKRKWKSICFTNDGKPLQHNDVNWKAECERDLALMLKFLDQQMFSQPKNLYLRLNITAMDYYDGMLLCFGENDYDLCAVKNISAFLYQCSKHTWKLVTSFPIWGYPNSIMSCCLLPGYKILGGRADGSLLLWNLEISSRLVSLETEVRAHSKAIIGMCTSMELGIVATAGIDDKLKFWHVGTGAEELASFVFPGIKDAKILTGDKSPFMTYNCFLVTTKQEDFGLSVAMGCWGNNIPLKESLIAPEVCHTEKYDFGWIESFIKPDVFVQGGSLVYALELVHPYRKRVYKMVWQPLEPDDFVSTKIPKYSKELEYFRTSLHPCRKSCAIPLPVKTTRILGVGKHISICATGIKEEYSTNLTSIVNETGQTETLLYSWTEYSTPGFDSPAKIVCTKWLDGVDYIKPGSIFLILSTNTEGFMIWTWRKDVFEYEKPSLSKLLAVRGVRRGITASLV